MNSTPTEEYWTAGRQEMVRVLEAYHIRDRQVLDAMGKIRRHIYIPPALRDHVDAYGDHPCPIGFNQTISQPFMVAYMTELMKIKPKEKILEIGTGSGYQAAILAELGGEVFSIEIISELADRARHTLASEGYTNVNVLTGDGYKGWPEHAPFDVIIVTCAPEAVPRALVNQLKDNGRMVIPVGSYGYQRLIILRKNKGTIRQEEDIPVSFVPMIHGSAR